MPIFNQEQSPSGIAGGETQMRMPPQPQQQQSSMLPQQGGAPPQGGGMPVSRQPMAGGPQGQPMQGGPQQGGQGGGPLFPNGFEAQPFSRQQPVTPEEQQQIQQANQVAKAMVSQPEMVQALERTLQNARGGSGAVQLLAGHVKGVMQEFNQHAKRVGGMSSVMWVAAVATVVVETVKHAQSMGAEMNPDAGQQVLMLSLAAAGQDLVKSGQVGQQEMAQLVQGISQKRGQQQQQRQGGGMPVQRGGGMPQQQPMPQQGTPPQGHPPQGQPQQPLPGKGPM